jgi:hypothetical protein
LRDTELTFDFLHDTTKYPIHPAAMVLAGAVLLCVPACGDDASPAGAPSGQGNVTGVVARQKTGDGIANAIVALVGNETVVAVAVTDAAGQFAFSDVPAGDYTARLVGLALTGLSLLHTAFEPLQQSLTVSGEPVDLVFAAVGLVPGKVVGELRCGGLPVEGAKLRVVGGATDARVETGGLGRYSASDLAEGSYTVMVEQAPCAVQPPHRVVSLRPGQSVSADFEG